MRHLFSLCENKAALPGAAAGELAPEAALDDDGNPIEVTPAPETATGAAGADAALALVRATTAAALSKELLKLGSSKVEKAVDKEYVKILASLSFESWIGNYDVRFHFVSYHCAESALNFCAVNVTRFHIFLLCRLPLSSAWWTQSCCARATTRPPAGCWTSSCWRAGPPSPPTAPGTVTHQYYDTRNQVVVEPSNVVILTHRSIAPSSYVQWLCCKLWGTYCFSFFFVYCKMSRVLSRSPVAFVNLAAGLTDLIEIAARSSVLDMSMDEGASFCADDASQGGLGSLPGSAVKPRRAAPRKSASATKAPASRPASARTSNVRPSARRPSYVEHDSESDEEPVSDVEEEASVDESGSESEPDDEACGTGEENVEEGKGDVSSTMSPTKQFLMTAKGGVRGKTGRTAKAAAGKKIAMQLDSALSAADDSSTKRRVR